MSSRVLVVSDYGWPTGGTEEFVNELLIAIRRRRAVELLTWVSSRAPVPRDIEVTSVDNGDMLQVWSAVARADVVAVVTSFNVRLLARATQEVLRHTATPTITIVQTSAHSSPAAAAARHQAHWLGGLIARSEVVVGASDAVIAGLRALVAHPPSLQPLVPIENGARLVDHAKRERRRHNVLFIGRPADSKGYPVFLRLASELDGEDLRFFANTVSVAPEVEAPNVQYSRCLSDEALLTLFATTDLVVAPYWRADGLPLALLEAINCGVPVVGFDSPAVGPLLRRYGQLVVPCDASELIRTIRAWHAGSVHVQPPRPGEVVSLRQQAERHADLITAVGQVGPESAERRAPGSRLTSL